jgi:hypothetical protein
MNTLTKEHFDERMNEVGDQLKSDIHQLAAMVASGT